MTNYSKTEAREMVQGRIEALSSDDYKNNSDVAVEHLRKLLIRVQGKYEIKSILSYQALSKWKEIDVTPLEMGFPDFQFDHAPQSASGNYPHTQYDCILIPLFGFNDQKYRLGHGKGWYDRLLVIQPKALSIGVGLEINKIPFVFEAHDMPMDCVVTETGAR